MSMASSKEYLDFILEQLSELDDVSHRAMMGEFIVYYRGRVVGGIYDDRFLVKPTKAAASMNTPSFMRWRRLPDLNWSIAVLQTAALPLG